jgi:starvation-inducible DNA-binding protein
MATEKLNVGLSAEQRAGVVETLNTLLADEHVLYIKTRNYHWNVVGPRFNDLHKFFEEQYTFLAQMIDETAENARQFGGVAAGTMAEFLELSRLKEQPGHVPDENGMLQDLLDDHETVIRALREDIEKADEEYEAADAADFLTAQLEAHNKMAWMLRSFLGTAPGKVNAKRRTSDELAGSRR